MGEYDNKCAILVTNQPHSSVPKNVGELEIQDTPQTHDLWPDSKYNSELKIGLD